MSDNTKITYRPPTQTDKCILIKLFRLHKIYPDIFNKRKLKKSSSIVDIFKTELNQQYEFESFLLSCIIY